MPLVVVVHGWKRRPRANSRSFVRGQRPLPRPLAGAGVKAATHQRKGRSWVVRRHGWWHGRRVRPECVHWVQRRRINLGRPPYPCGGSSQARTHVWCRCPVLPVHRPSPQTPCFDPAHPTTVAAPAWLSLGTCIGAACAQRRWADADNSLACLAACKRQARALPPREQMRALLHPPCRRSVHGAGLFF